jgi:OmpA-like transmembrane domain
MHLGFNMKKAIVFAVMLSAWGFSSAQSYVGVDLTLSKYGVDCAANNSCDAKPVGYGFRAGSKLAPGYVLDLDVLSIDGVEVGYSKFGKLQGSGSTSELYSNGSALPVRRTVSTSQAISATALYAALVAHANVAPDFDVVGKLGLAYVSSISSYRTDGVSEGLRGENHFAPFFGLALEYAVMNDWRLQAGVDVTRFDADERTGSISVLKFGVNYSY